jgi:hypothetical protein
MLQLPGGLTQIRPMTLAENPLFSERAKGLKPLLYPSTLDFSPLSAL